MRNIYIGIAVFLGIFLCYFVYNSEENQIQRADDTRGELIDSLSIAINEDSTENRKDKATIAILINKVESRENRIKVMNACKSINKSLEGTIKDPILCSEVPVLVPVDDLFYGVKMMDKPYISQHEQEHFKKENGGVLATDIATGFRAEIYAPDYLSEVKIYEVEVLSDDLLGNYVKLSWRQDDSDFYWILAHVETKLQTGDKVYTGQRIGQMDLSGYTTGYHLHQELWMDGVNISYSTRSKVLSNKRAGVYETPEENTIYLSTYDLGDVAQNDSTPCIGASGKDLCKLAETGIQSIALTVDMRTKLGVKFGDIVTLSPGDHKVQVEDEMNKRFRHTCIKREGYCIKGDIARYNGESSLKSGVYTIFK